MKLLPDNTIVKYGGRIHADESAALELASRLENVPAPRLHEVTKNPKNGQVIIRMDFMEGQGLDVLWPAMSEDEKTEICHQMRDILTAMRSLNSETGLIGSCNGGPARDCRGIGTYADGPFRDEVSFNLFASDLDLHTPEPIRAALSQALGTGHRIVFSHGDLSPHNILVKNGRITGLIDWECAGWYPEYWEYVKFLDRPKGGRDWKNRVRDIFPQTYDHELLVHEAILRWQRP